MKNYELLYILPANLTSEEIKSNFEEIESNIKKSGARMLETLLDHPFLVKSEISKEEESEKIKNLPVTKRRLAYAIKKNRFGFYCLANFASEPEKIKEIDNYIKMNNAVLRHIIIQADPMSKEELKNLQKLFAAKRAEQEKERKEVEEKERRVEIKKDMEKIKEKKETKEKIKEIKEIKEIKKEEKETAEEKEKMKKKGKTGKERKKKIKLEDLEEKLDKILEDTII